MRAGGFPGNPGGLVVSIVQTAGARAPAPHARGRGRRTWRPTERTAGARMVPPGEGNEARGDGRRGVGVSHSTAEAGELSPRDPVEGRGHRQGAPLEGKTANTPRLGPVSTSRQRIAELARQALGMAVAIAWLPGPAGTRRRVAKLSVEEPDAAEPARPDLWGARVSNDPGLPDPVTLPRLTKDLGIAAVPHGFRSSFRDWAAERTNAPREVVEAALAYTVQNPTEAAYARSDLFERRRRLMNDWAAYLNGQPQSDTHPVSDPGL